MCKECIDQNRFAILTAEEIEVYNNLLDAISICQEKLNMYDTDRIVNEAKDGLAGRLIGFNVLNRSKNGFDCENSNGELLEVKAIGHESDWSATFNDTTEAKALEFKKKNVYIQAPVYLTAKKISFFLIGNNPEVGDFLLDAARKYNKSKSRRCSPKLQVTKMYTKYGFKIVAVDESKEQVVNRLKNKHKKVFSDITVNDIMSVAEYNEWKANNTL